MFEALKKINKKSTKAAAKKKTEFSKVLLIQESILIWVVTIALLVMAFISINHEYCGELPWLATMVGFPWAAYGVSQACYYQKSKAENTKNGIKYESVLHGLDDPPDEDNNDFDEEANG